MNTMMHMTTPCLMWSMSPDSRVRDPGTACITLGIDGQLVVKVGQQPSSSYTHRSNRPDTKRMR
jgi:hypothetical protein